MLNFINIFLHFIKSIFDFALRQLIHLTTLLLYKFNSLPFLKANLQQIFTPLPFFTTLLYYNLTPFPFYTTLLFYNFTIIPMENLREKIDNMLRTVFDPEIPV